MKKRSLEQTPLPENTQNPREQLAVEQMEPTEKVAYVPRKNAEKAQLHSERAKLDVLFPGSEKVERDTASQVTTLHHIIDNKEELLRQYEEKIADAKQREGKLRRFVSSVANLFKKEYLLHEEPKNTQKLMGEKIMLERELEILYKKVEDLEHAL